jgi:hypothetical protein
MKSSSSPKPVKKKSFGFYFSLIASLSIVTAGAIYSVYGLLPHEDYLPASLMVIAAVGVFVYIVLARIVEL